MPLTPLVYWAQRHEEVYLRIELTDARNISIHVHENVLHFAAQGNGAKGQNEYEFNLAFLLPVKTKVHKSTQRQVNITVKKEQWGWWERLTLQERRPVFLSPDFDRWLEESDAEMEIREKEERKNRLKAARPFSLNISGFISLKTGYLFVYNLVQFLGYSWMFINMTVRLVIFGKDSFYDTFHTMSDVMYFCQALSFVEILNVALGIVHSPIGPTVGQVLGRNFFLFIIFGSLEQMHRQPVVFFVFYLWSFIELVRYPFYMLGCINVDWKPLTWLRYSIWIPLYPLGVLSELAGVIQSIPIFDETRLFSIPLPEAIGTSLSFSCLLYPYVAVMFVGLYFNMRHLYKQRQKRLSTKKRKAN
uniref:Very-long-chain (3R)-3-hydroxyacyl-CoA dehydratase n=1 Tax=Salarias fasciatus TaxID=181472 RepID=A0A672J3J4_SALFA